MRFRKSRDARALATKFVQFATVMVTLFNKNDSEYLFNNDNLLLIILFLII